MAKKKAPAKKGPKPAAAVPLTPVAAMIAGCKGQLGNLPVLADWLEERLDLPATAALLRAPNLQPLSRELSSCEGFEFFPLGPDAFLWLAQGHYRADKVGFDHRPCVVVGLYAHPEGRPADWTRISSMVPLKVGKKRDPDRPWLQVVKEDPRVEAARTELAACAGRVPK
jgi:hypothetical protein